uniref:Transmembrane protein 159 n=1 Tax=Molossus molossus TaxID=27622 RepID=A0A7J8J329_MOLMO|nr:transmembrane protein 159 [Molossus molossus]
MAVSPAPCHPETPPRPGKPVTTRDWVTGAIRLRSTLESLPVEELIPKSLKCCRMAKEETPSISKDLQELWRKLSLLIDSVQNNSKILIHGPWDGFGLRDVLATDSQDDGAHYQSAKSRGGCLYEVSSGSVPGQAPFCSPHFAGVRGGVSGSGWVLPAPCGLVISVGGLSLFCVLCGLGFVSLAISGTIIVCYVVVSSLINHWFSSGPLIPDSSGDCQLTVKPAGLEGRYQE